MQEEPSARHNLQGYTKQNKAVACKSSDNQCSSGRYCCSNPSAKVDIAEVGACGGRLPGEQERATTSGGGTAGLNGSTCRTTAAQSQDKQVATGAAAGGTTVAKGGSRRLQESRSQQEAQLQPQQERAEEEPQEQQQGQIPLHQTPEEGEQRRQGDLPDRAPAGFVRDPLLSPPIPPVESLSLSPWTPYSPLGGDVSPEPRRSTYRAERPFHLVLRSCVPLLPVLPQPPESSLTVFHDRLSNYLLASCPIVSRDLSALVML
ncbi:unnamed protein product [Closterium sp. NIES-53]